MFKSHERQIVGALKNVLVLTQCGAGMFLSADAQSHHCALTFSSCFSVYLHLYPRDSANSSGSVFIISIPEEQPLTCLTFLGDDDAQQRTGRGDSFVEVVVIVDWQEVSMDISVVQLHVCTRDAMDGLEEITEFQKASRAVSLQTKAAIFCFKLVRGTRERPVSQLVQQQLWRPACN